MRFLLLLIGALLLPGAAWADEVDRTGWQTHVDEEWGYSIQYPPDWNVEAGPSDTFHLKLVPPGEVPDRSCSVITIRRWWRWLVPNALAMEFLTKEGYEQSLAELVDTAQVIDRKPARIGDADVVTFRSTLVGEFKHGRKRANTYSLVTYRRDVLYHVTCMVFEADDPDKELASIPIVESFRLR